MSNDNREETYYIVSYDSIQTLTLNMLISRTNNLQIGFSVRKKKMLKLRNFYLEDKICILKMTK